MLYPGFQVYLSGGQRSHLKRGQLFIWLFVLAGVLFMMLALGGLIALVSDAIGKVLTIFIPLADVIIIYISGRAAPLKYQPIQPYAVHWDSIDGSPLRKRVCFRFAI